MTGRDAHESDSDPAQNRAVEPEQGVASDITPEDLLNSKQVLKLLAQEMEDAAGLDDTSPLPRIKSMPPGITVVEQSVGHAVGQWVLQVRCECGRRWFEVEKIDYGKCPRCGSLVRVEVEGGAAPTSSS